MKAFFKSPTFKKILKKLTGEKKKPIDPNKRDFDIIWIGGLHSANMIKYFQHKHFHGTMAGFNTRSKFFNEHLYEYVIGSNMKVYKYLAMPFSSNFEVNDSKYARDRVVDIRPETNELVTEKGDVYTYKALVLNTGLNQSSDNMPYLKNLIADEYAKTRVFVHDVASNFQVARNQRIFQMHKDGDFIVYLPGFPSRREAYDHWYLALDSYLSRGVMTEAHNRGQKIRVITPNNYLFRFPFANEVILEEISNRPMIEVHYGYELSNVEVSQEVSGWKRKAFFKNVATGEQIELPFGTLLLTPENKKREVYMNNDIADEHGLVKVNPYTLQHVKYQNIFAFGDCINADTTKSFWAATNQGVVVRNNVWDYVHGEEFKAIYEGYTSFTVHHSIDRVWVFKHRYNYEPTATNFYIPRFLGAFAYKLKNSLEKNFMSKIFQKKANFGYPYLMKDRYFRPLWENRFLKEKKIDVNQVFIHKNVKPELSFEKDGHHGHGDHAHAH